ncbi:hypothetical protein SARC_00499 [Sphaeroforma arctica JP610]|uniref:MIP18 family-like domain-containing protein n=1 Tax=Sphaeroforma arctica JP610 TaxID=667725 RepID=A0A0L0GEV4_9EUKA|nr:hypothetical protein SARC_00499 [Sphaeroforma arctica JP610]KNC87409.1 hypothetical protein SARC_00499 [Sphaeroforma arctica JP610]|eukprot:XP_014161311.1 hypothetical protein SARC_00499 [Sphaeroforma arctica JP610]
MSTKPLDNEAPTMHQKTGERALSHADYDDEVEDVIDEREIFDIIRMITDPEHPNSLEELGVTNLEHIEIDLASKCVAVEFTPTIPHCSMASLIALSIRTRLIRSLPIGYKIDVRVRAGTHASERSVNKQVNDKERVAAALENSHLMDVVNQCLTTI